MKIVCYFLERKRVRRGREKEIQLAAVLGSIFLEHCIQICKNANSQERRQLYSEQLKVKRNLSIQYIVCLYCCIQLAIIQF